MLNLLSMDLTIKEDISKTKISGINLILFIIFDYW